MLTEPNGLFSDPLAPAKLLATSAATNSANQLKHVSRQLYAETNGLGLEFNVVNFKSDYEDDTATIKHFHDFFNICSPSNRRRLRAVVEESWPRDEEKPRTTYLRLDQAWLECAHSLMDICRENPGVQVVYRTTRLSHKLGVQTLPLAVRCGMIISDGFRGTNFYTRHFERSERQFFEYHAMFLRQEQSVKLFDLENIRFFPKEATFDEALLRNCRNYHVTRFYSGLEEQNPETWIKLMKEWCEHGI